MGNGRSEEQVRRWMQPKDSQQQDTVLPVRLERQWETGVLSPSGSENHGRDRVACGVEGKRQQLLGVQHEAE